MIGFFIELAFDHAVLAFVVASSSLLIALLLVHIPLRIKAFVSFLHKVFKRFSAHDVLHMGVILAGVNVGLVGVFAHLVKSPLIINSFHFTSHCIFFVSCI